MILTATITSKGQITLPKAIRQRLKGRVVEFEVEGDDIRLRSIPDAGASLKDFGGTYVGLEEVREQIWGKKE